MKRTILLLAASGFVSTAAFAAGNDARSGQPTDTGTSVDRLMEEKIISHHDEPLPPKKGEKPLGLVKVHEETKEAEPAAGEPSKEPEKQ